MKKCKVKYLNKEYEVYAGTLTSAFIERIGEQLKMPCAGMGRCGKCRVKFKYGAPKETGADRMHLSDNEIKEGYRLSCRALITEDAEIEKISPIDEGLSVRLVKSRINELNIKNEVDVAIDLGTTTIAVAIMNNSDDHKELLFCATIMNRQWRYGADVISRIQAANTGKADELRKAVVDDLREVTEGLPIKRMMIAGNTTMQHILMGDSCEGLGKAPYTPARLSYPNMKLSDILGYTYDTRDNSQGDLFPGISAFVGADIVSGMYYLSFDNIAKGKKYMLIDLGTNGEMAIADSGRITVCSTAAGPVFEGGGITCGMPGVAGAIEHITLKYDNATNDSNKSRKIRTELGVIGNEKPVGICGSGVLELVSELRKEQIIDETGLFKDDYFEEGIILYKEETKAPIVFSQDDIRKVQLAKAAIRSGIDTLLAAHGCNAQDIDKVYLAGGFSEHLDLNKIKYLKMLPDSFLKEGVTECVGNTSLAGCIKALGDERFMDSAMNIISRAEEIKLAENELFEEDFIDAMNF